MKNTQAFTFRVAQFISFTLASTAILGIAYAVVQLALGNYTSTASREF